MLLYDKRDNRLDPTTGYFAQLSTDLAGLGGDVRYGRAVVAGGTYYGWAPYYVLSLTGEGGIIQGIDMGVLIEDRFFVGGDNLRGFKIGGIGPRDLQTNDTLGGNIYYIGSLQQSFPIGLPPELGFSAHVFSDFGTLYGINDVGNIGNSNSIRVSAGTGFSWKSPMGPIRVDIARPVIRQYYDKSLTLNVNFGTRF